MSSPVERLTDRQKDCLRLVGRGLSAKRIALELGISPETVEHHLKNARSRLGVSDSLSGARLLEASEAHPHKVGTHPQRLAEVWDLPPDGGAPSGSGRRDETMPAPPVPRIRDLLFPPIGRPPNALGIKAQLNLILLQAGILIASGLAFILLFYAFGWAIMRLVAEPS